MTSQSVRQMKSDGNNTPAAGMSGSPQLLGTSSTAGATSSFFVVLTLDIPFNVLFHAPAPLAPLCYRTSLPSDVVAPINPPPSRSPTNVSRPARRRYCDVIMSRDRTPEAAGRVVVDRGRRARHEVTAASVSRHDVLSRPRSRSVCASKYCSVGALKSSMAAAASDRGMTAVRWSARPHSANNARHLPAPTRISTTRHQLPATATDRIHAAKHPVHNDVTVDDNDDTGTSSSAVGDSGVTSSLNDDVITSRDTSPWSDGSEEGQCGRREMIKRMTETDRQNQLRRFLDAVSQSSSSSDAQLNQQQQLRQWQQQQLVPAAHSDVSDDDVDDDDDDKTETRRESVNESQDSDDLHSLSAMDQVRDLVTRCRLPVYPSTRPSCDASQRLDTWTRTIKHHSSHPSSMTSESIQRAVLGAAAELVRAAR